MKPTLEQIKTDESVWPENATHYNEINKRFYILGDTVQVQESNGEWLKINIQPESVDDYIGMIPRPTKAFVPEVGEWCEALLEGEFKKAQALKYHDKTHAIAFDFIDCLKWSSDYRPIKSELDLFIDKSREVTNASESDTIANDLFNDMFVAGCRYTTVSNTLEKEL